MSTVKLTATRAEIFDVLDADVEEFCQIEAKIDRIWPEYKGMGEGLAPEHLFSVLLMLCAQLRRQVRELEARIAVFDDPTRRQ